MELGEKLKNARLEAGMSQRELCGDTITRNMLSQIEHGTACPSMDTLRCLASRLGKPVSFFLEEETVYSPNQKAMVQARAAFDRGDDFAVLEALKDFREPDTVFAIERELLESLSLLGAAQKAMEDGRGLHALELLNRAEERESSHTLHLRRKRLLLMARAGGDPGKICRRLDSMDEELLLRARNALAQGNGVRAGELLDAAEDKSGPLWNCLRAEAFLLREDYAAAVRYFHRAEDAFPDRVAPGLEQCYRELGDYKQAYVYACRQKKQE